MGLSLRNYFFSKSGNVNSNAIGFANQGVQTPTMDWEGIDGSAQFIAPQRLRDVVGKLKISQSQNIYDADFEYGVQPLRWENVIQNVSGQAYIVQNPGLGGVSMNIGGGNTPGDITIRQSRPYHRYQPGKTFYMASNVNFGTSVTGQYQRVGIFDDSNGIFFMQYGTPTPTNPYAMNVVVRSDSGGLPVDTVFSADTWNGNKQIRDALDWTKVQMTWMEYAWYGAGALRWGVVLNGEPYILHQIGAGNGAYTGSSQTTPWSRTGNLPVRYEQRDTGSAVASLMTHYGVSVLIEGSIDKQRGFTYSYGNNAKTQNRSVPASSVRYPAMSFRMRAVGSDIFDQTNAACTGGSPQTLTISAATPAISSVVGQPNSGQALVTFGSAHGYAVTNPANANNPAQYVTLSSFTQVATSTSTNYSISNAAVALASYSFQSNTNVSGASGTNQFLVSNAISASTGQPNLLAVGQVVNGTGVATGTTISAVTYYGTVSNPGDGLSVVYPTTAIVTLSANLSTQAAGTYSIYAPASSTLLTTTAVASGAFQPGMTLSGTGVTSGTTITAQLTAFNASVVAPTFASGGAAGQNTIVLSAGTSISAGQYVTGTGVPPGTIVESIATATVTLSNNLTVQAAGTYTFYSMAASQAYASGGAVGSSVIVLAAGTNFAVGQIFTGIGVPNSTIITVINGSTITLNKAFTVQASGQYSAQAPAANGVYQLSTNQGTVSGTVTGTTTYAAQTWLIQQVPTTTTMVLPIQLVSGATLTSTPTATYWAANQWVGKFVYYQASLPSISAIAAATSSTIAGLTQYSAVITFASAHGLKQGDVIIISGSSPTTYNGIWSVSIPATNPTTTASITFGTTTPGSYVSGASAVSPYTGRITSNTTSAITFGDVVTGQPLANAPASGNSYQIGLIDRGQLLPATLLLNSSATCLVELISSTPTNQLSLQNASFVALNTLGSYNSFAEQDLSAIQCTGGEVVYAFSTPPNGLQQLDLGNFFPVLTNVRGNVADILTVAVTSSAGATVQVNVVAQEAMA